MRKAFTLIELLIYMALVGVFLVILTNMLATILETQTESARESLVDIDGRYILARMAYDANNLVANPAYYTLTGGNLLLGTDRLNSQDVVVSEFTVTPVEDTVRVKLTVGIGDQSRSYTTTVGKR